MLNIKNDELTCRKRALFPEYFLFTSLLLSWEGTIQRNDKWYFCRPNIVTIVMCKFKEKK